MSNSHYNNVRARGRESFIFFRGKKRVFEVDPLHLKYTLFPSNKIYKKIDRMSK